MSTVLFQSSDHALVNWAEPIIAERLLRARSVPTPHHHVCGANQASGAGMLSLPLEPDIHRSQAKQLIMEGRNGLPSGSVELDYFHVTKDRKNQSVCRPW